MFLSHECWFVIVTSLYLGLFVKIRTEGSSLPMNLLSQTNSFETQTIALNVSFIYHFSLPPLHWDWMQHSLELFSIFGCKNKLLSVPIGKIEFNWFWWSRNTALTHSLTVCKVVLFEAFDLVILVSTETCCWCGELVVVYCSFLGNMRYKFEFHVMNMQPIIWKCNARGQHMHNATST